MAGTTRNVVPGAIENIPFKKPRRDVPLRESSHTAPRPPFRKYESHQELKSAVESSNIKDLFLMSNSTIGMCVGAKIGGDTCGENQEEVHQEHTGEEDDCDICGNFFKTFIQLKSDKLEQATKQQSESVIWKESRRIRITASTANKVPKRSSTNPDKFIREHIFPRFQGNKATKHGQTQEIHAKQFYSEHFKVCIEDRGSVMREDNKWLSASPDGIIDGKEILEVKCPDTSDLKLLFAGGKYDVKQDTNGSVFLDPKGQRGYYVQIQLTMYCCELEQAKLMIWKDRDEYQVVDVAYDQAFVTNTVERLKKFYFTKLLPRIVDDYAAKRLMISSAYTALT